MYLGLSLRQENRLTLDVEQKHALKYMLQLMLELRHEDLPEMVKGFDGMQVADEVLKQKQARGVLIGGLSEAIWNQRRRVADLYEHKDVDVLVLDEGFVLDHAFQGGIDWWLREKERIDYSTYYGSSNRDVNFYRNANDVVLSFDLRFFNEDLDPGLYILSQSHVVRMRLCEVLSRIDYGVVNIDIDSDTIEAYKQRVAKKMGKALPRFILDRFDGQILSERYSHDFRVYDWLDFDEFDIETVRAINTFLKDRSKE